MQATHQNIRPLTTARARLDALAWLDRRQAWERRLSELEGTRVSFDDSPGAYGNNTLGTNDSRGQAANPVTWQPASAPLGAPSQPRAAVFGAAPVSSNTCN